MPVFPQTLVLSFWRLVREWKIPWSLRFSLRRQKQSRVKHSWEILIPPHTPRITLCVSSSVIQEPTWPGHQLPSPVPRPTHVLAAHRASDFGSVPGWTAAPQPVPAEDSLSPRGKDTQHPDPNHGSSYTGAPSTPSTETYLPKHLLLGTPPGAPC